MVKSFALRHWSDFEQLAFEFTTNSFGLVPTKLLRTQESKDGGFDAVFVHELGKLNDTVIGHETLMEAKLRSSDSAIGLRAFSATMIIAFNGTTHCLVIVTNRGFSPQALAAARDFQWKSRLRIILADRRTLSAWIRPRLSDLKSRYAPELLDEILLPDPADENYHEIQIPAGEVDGTEPKARVAFGRNQDGCLATGEIVPIAEFAQHIEPISIIGAARRQLAKDLANALSTDAGCACIQGESGSGKSHVVRAMIVTVSQKRQCLGLIDMSRTVTARQVFLALLANLLGIDIAETAQHFTEPASEQVFATARGASIPGKVRAAVLSVLKSDSRSIRDIDQVELVRYLTTVAQTGRSQRRLLAFHNLDKTAGEALEFMQSVLPLLTENNISVVLEVTIGSEAPLVGVQSWNAYVKLFESLSSLGCFRVPNLSAEDGEQLLLERLPGLGLDRARFICQRVGTRPLFLHHAALWLKRQQVVIEQAQGVYLVEDPLVFFEGLRPEACISILDRHIDLWRRDIALPYADVIVAASLLNGHLPNTVVELLKPDAVHLEAMLDRLVETGLFVPEKRLSGIQVSHSLLLERMIAIEGGRVPGYAVRRFDRKRVADKLLSNIASYTTPGILQDFYCSALYVAVEDWEKAWEHSQRAGSGLVRENQLLLAAEAFDRGVDAAEKLAIEGDPRGAAWRISSLIDLLQVEDERYRLGLEQSLLRLERLNVNLRMTVLPDWIPVGEFQMRAAYLNWRAAFTRENFDGALPVARDLFSQATQSPEMNERLTARAIAALGITFKALEQPEQSRQTFDKGVAMFPNSIYVKVERWSNLAALALRSDPADAVHYFRLIIENFGSSASVTDRA